MPVRSFRIQDLLDYQHHPDAEVVADGSADGSADGPHQLPQQQQQHELSASPAKNLYAVVDLEPATSPYPTALRWTPKDEKTLHQSEGISIFIIHSISMLIHICNLSFSSFRIKLSRFN